MEPEPPGAAFFCLETELTQIVRSLSRLRDLGLPEQHWFDNIISCYRFKLVNFVVTVPSCKVF